MEMPNTKAAKVQLQDGGCQIQYSVSMQMVVMRYSTHNDSVSMQMLGGGTANEILMELWRTYRHLLVP
jgi:hypothetical protein